MNTILITGATGFIGSHILKKLLQLGYKVIITIRNSSNLDRINTEIKYVKYYNIDCCNIDIIFQGE